jgi:hypothetical protein
MALQLDQLLNELPSLEKSELVQIQHAIWYHLMEECDSSEVERLLTIMQSAAMRKGSRSSAVETRPELIQMVIEDAKELLNDPVVGLSQADKALIAGFIYSLDSKTEDFPSRAINELLETMGLQKITNITSALNSLETQRLVETTEKAGDVAQSQKRHKLTAQGQRRATLLLKMRKSA